MSLLKVTVTAVSGCTIAMGVDLAGTEETTVGLAVEPPPALPGAVQDPPPPPPQPDMILTNILIITILTRYAFCDINPFINPPFEKLLTTRLFFAIA
jgi:hypothetical protein